MMNNIFNNYKKIIREYPKGITYLSEKSNVTRQAIYKWLDGTKTPDLITLLSVLQVCGYDLVITGGNKNERE